MFYDSIPTDLGEWVLSQPLFFTASAPLHAANTHVNVSPKGLLSSTFTILDPNTCAYLDGTGSGIETVSHVYESGRVTLMFCSFGKGPRVCRFFCKGRVVEWDAPEFREWVRRMGKAEGMVSGVRAVVVLHVWQVGLLFMGLSHFHQRFPVGGYLVENTTPPRMRLPSLPVEQ